MLSNFFKFKPHLLILAGYLSISLIFSFILLLPFTHKGNLEFIDAFFTSTSSLCVTGHIVKDTEKFWTMWGKFIILFLIQIGGLGYMTLLSYFFLILKGGVPISLRVITRETQTFLRGIPVRELILKVLIYSIIIETLGSLLLFLFTEGKDRLFHSVFHSISAFCNAGFSSYSENLMKYRDSPFYLLIVSFLFIIGGIGFFVLDDIYNFIKKRKQISYHSKVVIKTTLFLILFFSFLFLIIEWRNSLKDFNILLKIINSIFHVTTPRTAGFNALNIANFSMSTVLIIIFLMIVGGSPGGTAGGVKTTNFAILAAFLRSIFKGEEEVYLVKRRIENNLLIESLMIFSLYIFLVGFSLFLISIIEGNKFNFMEVLFEVISALSTVGLTLGSKIYQNVSLSADFSPFSKLVIISLMFIGRIGVFTVWSILVTRKKTLKSYPKGEILIV